MATISFKTRPQKRFYSYNETGTIYCINTTAPEITAENGGVWNCYFQCEPYHMVAATDTTEAKYYQLYEKISDNYSAVSSTAFNIGNKYYYTTETSIDSTNAKEHTDNIYYSKNGKYYYSMPSNASELPQTTYTDEDGTIQTYYFDTLIAAGDTYDGKNFKAMDRVPTKDTKETYGSLLADKVKDAISIYSFVSTVDSIPEYLKHNITGTIEYTCPDLSMYGEVFLEKLNDEMVETGETILSKYEDNTYKVSIEQKVEDNKGTITSTKEKKNND